MVPYSVRAEAMVRRYQDAYRVVNSLERIGESTKIAGVILGLVAGVGALVLARAALGTTQPLLVLASAALAFLVIWSPLWARGVHLCAMAQMDLACLDMAVNTSPFLDDEQRAAAMSLPAADDSRRRPGAQAAPRICHACADPLDEVSLFCPSCGARQEGVAC